MEVVKMLFGSSLYGTTTPESDTDYKGIKLSSWDEIALGKIPKQYENYSTGDALTKNTKDDVDMEIFSLHSFIKEALEGQTFALDMLHASEDKLVSTSEIWKDLVASKHKFYTKNIESFIGYAMGQAAKYGVKGSRLNDAKAVMDWLEAQIVIHETPQTDRTKIIDCDLSTFPVGEHIQWHIAAVEGKTCYDGMTLTFAGTDMIEVCQRKILLNSRLKYALDLVTKFYNQYGERAKQAADNKNVDWKAMHHALRAAYQIKLIFTEGTFSYPLPNTQHLIDVKLGKVDYKEVAQELEDLVDEVKILRDKSDLPENPDKEFWDKWLIETVERHVVPFHQIASREISTKMKGIKDNV